MKKTNEKGDLLMQKSKSKKSNTLTIKEICFTAVMAALIFVFTYTFKIPLGNGYTHIGDSIIFLSVALIGAKKSSLAAGVGAALADLISGYTVWVIPTFIIKVLMVIICGLIAEKLFKNKILVYIIGCISGGLFHFLGYSLAWFVLFDKAACISAMPALVLQTAAGLVIAVVLIVVFNKSGATEKLKRLSQ